MQNRMQNTTEFTYTLHTYAQRTYHLNTLAQTYQQSETQARREREEMENRVEKLLQQHAKDLSDRLVTIANIYV